MLNRHFLKRLFYFVLIIALGAVITLVVNYIETEKQLPETTEVDPSN